MLNERVVGIIIGRVMDEYRIDIGGAHPAMMSSIAFEGATQRNKPDLKVYFSTNLISLTPLNCYVPHPLPFPTPFLAHPFFPLRRGGGLTAISYI